MENLLNLLWTSHLYTQWVQISQPLTHVCAESPGQWLSYVFSFSTHKHLCKQLYWYLTLMSFYCLIWPIPNNYKGVSKTSSVHYQAWGGNELIIQKNVQSKTRLRKIARSQWIWLDLDEEDLKCASLLHTWQNKFSKTFASLRKPREESVHFSSAQRHPRTAILSAVM